MNTSMPLKTVEEILYAIYYRYDSKNFRALKNYYFWVNAMLLFDFFHKSIIAINNLHIRFSIFPDCFTIQLANCKNEEIKFTIVIPKPENANNINSSISDMYYERWIALLECAEKEFDNGEKNTS